MEAAQNKLRAIQEEHDGVGRLLYINLVGTHRPTRLFDRHFREVPTIAQAEIVIVQGALEPDRPEVLSSDMQHIIRFIGEGIL